MRGRLSKALVALLVFAASAANAAQPVKLVVGFAAGGGLDTLARILAQNMSPHLGQSIVVENRPGAGGTIAADQVMRATPDGTTLFMADTTVLTAPHIYPKVNFDPQKSFAPVGMVGKAHLVLAAANSFPAKTPQELLSAIRANPGKYSYASVGIGSVHHLSGELLKRTAKLDVVHVAYKGGAPAIKDILAGDIPLGITSLPPAQPHAKAGKLKLIATLTGKRLPHLPDLPSLSEAVPGFEAAPTIFLLAPAGTPAATVTKLNQALVAALRDKTTVEAFELQGATTEPSDPAQLGQWMRQEEARWSAVIKEAGIKAE
ncbi:MAG: tripartite tricarboxylate transporter substrate binding protein [Deltaproteobacteria bacterium]|nr:tripartite tricarboxylate transporter substrate binding protein [Deltaproteobacteria bacterium]